MCGRDGLRTKFVRERGQPARGRERRGLAPQVHYIAVNDLAMYRRLGFDPAATPIALDASQRLVSLPLFILHGTEDCAAKPGGSRLFHGLAGSTDKTLKLYEGHFHDLLRDIGKENVMQTSLAGSRRAFPVQGSVPVVDRRLVVAAAIVAYWPSSVDQLAHLNVRSRLLWDRSVMKGC